MQVDFCIPFVYYCHHLQILKGAPKIRNVFRLYLWLRLHSWKKTKWMWKRGSAIFTRECLLRLNQKFCGPFPILGYQYAQLKPPPPLGARRSSSPASKQRDLGQWPEKLTSSGQDLPDQVYKTTVGGIIRSVCQGCAVNIISPRERCKKKMKKKLTSVSFMYVCVAENGEMLVFFLVFFSQQ